MVKSRRRRMEAMRLIVERLRIKGPAFPAELMEELGIADRTVDYNLTLMVNLGIAKKLNDNRYAWIDYREIEEEVNGKLKRLRNMLLREPTIVEFAEEMRVTPDKAREYLYEFAEAYREPTANDIDRAANMLAFSMVIVSLLQNGVKEIVPHFAMEFLSFADYRTKNFPEFVPKMLSHNVEIKADMLHVKAFFEWSERARRVLSTHAAYERELKLTHPPGPYVMAPPSYRSSWS